MSQLYVLQLEDDKWYVGKTDDINKRFEQHKSGKGSAWTKEYKPIKIADTRTITSVHDETNVTKDLMKKYGIDNVRGGAYCQVDLPEQQINSIRHELNSGSDKCYNCGIKGHFANRCPNKQEETESDEELWGCGICEREFNSQYGLMVHQRSCKPKYTPKSSTGSCYRCGRPGHYSNECYAQRHVKGYELDD